MTMRLTADSAAAHGALLEALTGPTAGTVPDRADAIRVDQAVISREQLLTSASVVADRVRGASAVALEAVAGMPTVVAVVGCLLAGVPLVPLPPDSGPTERAHILDDSAADLVLGPSDIEVQARGGSLSHPEPTAESTALILYTSGTTGAPKGVPISRAAIAAGLDGLAEAWAWTPADVLVHGLPLFHVHGLVLGVLGPLRTG